MTARTNNRPPDQHPQASAGRRRPSEQRTNLSYLYGSIGIQAVAAAARYSDVRKKPTHAPADRRASTSASSKSAV